MFNNVKLLSKLWVLGLLLLSRLAGADGMATDPIRIVVVPFYAEYGTEVRKERAVAQDHYRNISRYFNNILVQHGFEVINPFAHEWMQTEYDKLATRRRSDSVLAASDLNRRFNTDVVYLVWLEAEITEKTRRDCTVRVRIQGEGYDSAAHDLGVGTNATTNVTSDTCDSAIQDAERQLANKVIKKITSYGAYVPASGGADNSASGVAEATSVSTDTNIVIGRSPSLRQDADQVGAVSATGVVMQTVTTGRLPPDEMDVAVTSPETGQSVGGPLARHATRLRNYLSVRLDGATEHEVYEIFGKVISTVPGVQSARPYNTKVEPNNAQASYTIWRVVMADGNDAFRFQANTVATINRILDTSATGAAIVVNGVPYRYGANELDALKGIRVDSTTSNEVVFTVDQERISDRDLSGTHSPYQRLNTNIPNKVQFQ